MRIIKLSDYYFNASIDVINFFENDIKSGSFNGKFRITKGRISRNNFQPDEKLIFSFNGTILYKAVSLSGICDNTDEYCHELPFYFQIDINSIKSVKIDLYDFEKLVNSLSIKRKSIVRSQGWPVITDTNIIDKIWLKLQ